MPDFPEDGRVIVALDVGTSSARACIYDAGGRPVEGRFHQEGYEAATTTDGGSEHDANRLLHAVVACLDRVLATPPPSEILGVGVTSFWHGLLGFDAAGHPITPLFTWADTRAAEAARQLRETLEDEAIHARTGCHVHACYWLLTPLAAADHTIIASGGALARSRAWTQIMADVLGHPLVLSGEHEATSRGGALLALESLGQFAGSTLAPAARGQTVEPDLTRHARYHEALARQRRLDERI